MNEDWEKEFEEKWYESFDYDGNKNLDKFGELKQFVESLLSTQRQEVIRRLEEMAKIPMKKELEIYYDLLADLRDGNV